MSTLIGISSVYFPQDFCVLLTETAVVVLDSIRASRHPAIEIIKSYLKEELKDKKKMTLNDHEDLQDINPSCPQQSDATSCGVFLLHFVEMLLKRC